MIYIYKIYIYSASYRYYRDFLCIHFDNRRYRLHQCGYRVYCVNNILNTFLCSSFHMCPNCILEVKIHMSIHKFHLIWFGCMTSFTCSVFKVNMLKINYNKLSRCDRISSTNGANQLKIKTYKVFFLQLTPFLCNNLFKFQFYVKKLYFQYNLYLNAYGSSIMVKIVSIQWKKHTY